MMNKRRQRRLENKKISFAEAASVVRYSPDHVPGVYSDASVWTRRKK
ncbi:hypothetical protein [Oceanispirochaeta sp.]|jgi:hypothetical protein|nr:hypothetical protein [Oceanispirochaeta sp.]MDA3956914.1 hypothetical protein [Oceanispirochaeta sp.]